MGLRHADLSHTRRLHDAARLAVKWTELARQVEPGIGTIGDGCELVVEGYGEWYSRLAVVWLEADDQPWRWALAEGSWFDRDDDLPHGEAATLHEAQAAAASHVRGELLKLAELLTAPAGQAVPR
jgi:hypothetical protein